MAKGWRDPGPGGVARAGLVRAGPEGTQQQPGSAGRGGRKVVDPSSPGEWQVVRQGTSATALELGSFGMDLGKSVFSRGWCGVGRGCPEGWGSLQPWGSARLEWKNSSRAGDRPAVSGRWGQRPPELPDSVKLFIQPPDPSATACKLPFPVRHTHPPRRARVGDCSSFQCNGFKILLVFRGLFSSLPASLSKQGYVCAPKVAAVISDVISVSAFTFQTGEGN